MLQDLHFPFRPFLQAPVAIAQPATRSVSPAKPSDSFPQCPIRDNCLFPQRFDASPSLRGYLLSE